MKTVTRRGFVGLCLGGGLVAAACLSPTLPPLPPPAEPEMQYLAPGQLQLTGVLATNRSALVFAISTRTGDVGGQVVRDGNYRFTLEAEPGDVIELWYEVGADQSQSLFLDAPKYPDSTDPSSSMGQQPDGGVPSDAGIAGDGGS